MAGVGMGAAMGEAMGEDTTVDMGGTAGMGAGEDTEVDFMADTDIPGDTVIMGDLFWALARHIILPHGAGTTLDTTRNTTTLLRQSMINPLLLRHLLLSILSLRQLPKILTLAIS